MAKDKNFKENMKNILTVLFCILFPSPFHVFLMFKVILAISTVHAEGVFSGKVPKISGSSKNIYIFWMNKNFCLFKIFHAVTCLLSCLVSYMFRTDSQCNLYRI